ncbi:pimeloyl-ACP methyl ester carboxylesterase [Actinokineospora baliensis]|uniref:alpha/beta fold hydrolase n=1 Tax=Actinokineospora baliensis TaxID=547056 RepID=UPI001957DB13|nr:alpha/beta hydrolase [Actinokineospora baliensis]MBM7776463.1 pimeloyl-ACP methyl ester carboxylesterase [Actinokineospora baliensis]
MTTKGVGQFKNAAAREKYLRAYETAMSQWPEPLTALDIETPHGTTRLYRFGSGPPVVLLPGLLATAACYWKLGATLGEHRTVYAIDTLGEGGCSVQSLRFNDFEDRAQCLDDVLAKLDLPPVPLVGASTGGWHAVNQAIHRPDRLESITLLDPTTVTASFSTGVAAFGLLTSILNRPWVWRRFLRWCLGEDIYDSPDVQLLLTATRTFRPGVPFQKTPAEEALRGISVPTLALFGGNSVVHDSAAAAHRFKDLVPHATVDTIAGAGHDLLRRPNDYDQIVRRILDFTA